MYTSMISRTALEKSRDAIAEELVALVSKYEAQGQQLEAAAGVQAKYTEVSTCKDECLPSR